MEIRKYGKCMDASYKIHLVVAVDLIYWCLQNSLRFPTKKNKPPFHRLALERQQAAAKTQTSKVDPKETLMDSFKKAGVQNFHMKSAVPGTEIPGHKVFFSPLSYILHL